MTIEERRRVARLLIATLGGEQTKLIADAVKRLGDTPEAQAVLEVAVLAATKIRPDLAATELGAMTEARGETPVGQAAKLVGRGWRRRTGRHR